MTKKNCITGTITTVDGTLVQETITVPFPSLQPGIFNLRQGELAVLVLTELEIEIVRQTDLLQGDADELTITITPNSETSHPTIIDNDCLFKFSLVTNEAAAATNSVSNLSAYLIKKWKLGSIEIMKPQFYLQITLDATATSVYYKIPYYFKKVRASTANIIAVRDGYSTS